MNICVSSQNQTKLTTAKFANFAWNCLRTSIFLQYSHDKSSSPSFTASFPGNGTPKISLNRKNPHPIELGFGGHFGFF